MEDDLIFDDEEDFLENPTEPINPLEPEPLEGEDLTTEVLRLKGISDPEKIKFEDESGVVTERSWDSLSREEQLNILAGEFEENDDQFNEDELQLLNAIRESGLSIEEYLNSLSQTTPIKSYKIDELSDDEVYALDLLEKIGSENITDEELEQAVTAAKQNETLFNKTVEGLRKEYVRLQEDEEAREAKELLSRLEEAYYNFATSILNEIKDLITFAGQDLELSEEDSSQLAEFMLKLDNNGISEFGKRLQDPKTFTEMAFWVLNKQQIIEELSKLMLNNYKRGFEAGKLDAAKSTLVIKPQIKKTSTNDYVDDDEWY